MRRGLPDGAGDLVRQLVELVEGIEDRRDVVADLLGMARHHAHPVGGRDDDHHQHRVGDGDQQQHRQEGREAGRNAVPLQPLQHGDEHQADHDGDGDRHEEHPARLQREGGGEEQAEAREDNERRQQPVATEVGVAGDDGRADELGDLGIGFRLDMRRCNGCGHNEP